MIKINSVVEEKCEATEYKVGETLFEIEEQVIRLSFHWKYFYQLYMDKDTEILFQVSPIFFMELKKILQGSIVITITRLFDSPDNFDRNNNLYSHNISFYYLLNQLRDDGFPKNELRKLSRKIDSFRQENKHTLFKYRNKYLAHNDFPTIKEEDLSRISKLLFSNVSLEYAVRFICELSNDFVSLLSTRMIIPANSQDYYAHPYFVDFEGNNADADKFVVVLKKALELKDKWWEK